MPGLSKQGSQKCVLVGVEFGTYCTQRRSKFPEHIIISEVYRCFFIEFASFQAKHRDIPLGLGFVGERANAFLRTLRVVRLHMLLRSTLKSYIGIGFAFGYGTTGLDFRSFDVGSLL